MKPQRIEVSYKTIIFIAAFIALLAFIWTIRSILVILFICFLFMEAINPAVVSLEKFKLPRFVAILLIYVGIIALVSIAFAGIIPIMIEQTTGLIRILPGVLDNLHPFGLSINSIDWASQLQFIETLPSNIAKTALSLFSNLFSLFIIFVITFYLLLERKNIHNYSFKIFGPNGREKTIKILELLEKRLGSWVSAEIILMTTIGLLSYLAYTLVGLNYTVPLAIIAGLLEAVPNIGPTIATVMAAIVGLAISPLTALLAIISGIVIQQLENNVIVPKVMKETIGLNPLITILAIAIGAKLAGIIGAVLAVPILLTIQVFVTVLTEKK
jgi:predicted PurR-regulated permease PerM